MRALASKASVLGAALMLTGCFGSPFLVVIDGQNQDFNAGVSTSGTSFGDTFQLSVSGRRDPAPNAVDDESALRLRIDFDKGALAGLPRGVALPIRGTTRYPSLQDSGGGQSNDALVAFEPGQGHTAAVRRVTFSQECFCRRTGDESQAWSGTITLTDAGANNLRYRIDLTMDGRIPFRGGPAGVSQHVEIDGDVESARP